MAITVNYENTDIIPEGIYEVLIGSPRKATTKGGTDYIAIPLTIRSDIEQPAKGQSFDHSIWKKKNNITDADKAVGGFSFGAIMTVVKAAGIPSGTQFDGPRDMFAAITDKPVKVEVEHHEFNGFTSPRVKAFMPSDYPNVTKLEQQDDDDLPF